MPYSPARYCKEPRCKDKTTDKSGYCELHRQEAQRQADANRPNANARGYGRRWGKASKQYLSFHPLCVICYREGVVAPATLVDHIIPHRGDYNKFWDRSNWQSLCSRHHSIKTAKEDGGFNNRIKSTNIQQ